ncbi:MAG: 30S ribosomal protein S6 [Spirochaetes bacterium]|nr:30S ribosomal protein S6 [Spirochaetota bacterium]
MRKYEILFFSENNDAVFTRARDKVKAVLESHQCTIDKEEDFGVKELTYDIGRINEGHYFFYNFSSLPAAIKEIEHEIRLDSTILRSMIVATDGK